MKAYADPSAPLSPALLTAVGDELAAFLDRKAPQVAEVSALPMLDLARTFTTGGKRLRPAFCYWSYVAAAGFPGEDAPLLRAAASLDLLHVSALVHDDLIDASDTRRGVPASHRQFAELHRSRGGRGDGDKFGEAAAILLGDLLLIWSIEMFDTCGLSAEAIARAHPLLQTMRTEVTCGQFLDVSAAFGVTKAATPAEELEVARKVLEFKSARYSVRRPAQIGAALGGADEHLDGALAEFGSVIGRAFQLRDDLLGVFGDPVVTGKPAGDDLAEGKRTVLVLTALTEATETDRVELDGLLGARGLSSEEISRAREIIETTGARQRVEDLIDQGAERALLVLQQAEMTDSGRTALSRLAELSIRRDR